jgi:CRP-like cAMP-binding protein
LAHLVTVGAVVDAKLARRDGGEAAAPHNRLLAALPATELRRVLPHMQALSVEPKTVLQQASAPVEYVYFPTGGVLSITTALPEGVSVEAATVGDEGMLGIEAFLSPTRQAKRCCRSRMEPRSGSTP